MKKILRKTILLLAALLVSITFAACPNSNSDGTVYITETGNAYHKTSGAHGYKTQSISKDDAKKQGYTACKNGCY